MLQNLQQTVFLPNMPVQELLKEISKKSVRKRYQMIWIRTTAVNQRCPKSNFISSLKDDIRLQNYLVKIQDHQLMTITTKFRISDLDLQIKKEGIRE